MAACKCSPTNGPRCGWPTLAIAALTLLSAALRSGPLGESLWIDELHTAWCALAGLAEVSERAAIGNQSPPFFWLEWLIIRVFGLSELALRLPSVVAGSLLPLAVFVVARRWTSVGAGLTAAALISVDPLAIFYSTEARPYALVQSLAVVHIGLTAELLARPRPWLRILWIAIAALIFHLHYTAGLLIAAEVVGYCTAAAFWPRDIHHRWQQAASDALLVALLMLPAGSTLSTIFARRANWAEFVPQADVWQAFVWWPTALGGCHLLAALLTGRRSTFYAPLLLVWAAVPVALAWLLTELDIVRLFYPRYLVVVQPAAALLAASCVELAPWRSSKWLVACLIVAASAWSGGMVERLSSEGRVIEPRGEDWRGAVTWLNKNLPEGPYPVLVHSGLIEAKEYQLPTDELLKDYLLLPVTSLYPLEADEYEIAPLPLSAGSRLDQTIEMLILHRGGAWLIVRGNEASAIAAAKLVVHLLKGFDNSGAEPWSVSPSRSSGNVQIILVKSGALNEPSPPMP